MRRSLGYYLISFGFLSTVAALVAIDVAGRALEGLGLGYQLFGLILRPFILVSLLALTRFPFRIGKRLIAERAHEVGSRDNRAPVLFLRSFADDNIDLPSMSALRRYLTGRNFLWNYTTFEEMLVRVFCDCGPVVAIGRPGEMIPPIGAARQWLSNDTWKRHIEELLSQCRVVVMVLGEIRPNDGLSWEVQKVFESSNIEKLIIVVPPLPETQIRLRWEAYRELSGGKLSEFHGGGYAVTFTRDGVSQVIYGPTCRWLGDYLQALSVPAWLHNSPRQGRAATDEIVFGLLSFVLPTRKKDMWTHLLSGTWCSFCTFVLLEIGLGLYRWSGILGCAWLLCSSYALGWLIGRYELMKLRVSY
jgi:hypothetical protein